MITRGEMIFNKTVNLILRAFLQRSMSTEYITLRELWNSVNGNKEVNGEVVTNQDLNLLISVEGKPLNVTSENNNCWIYWAWNMLSTTIHVWVSFLITR